jgi:hypothetical protein
MCVANDVPVNLECGTCIGMPELTLSDFRRSPGVEQESGVTMTERVESASGREVPTDEISSQVDLALGHCTVRREGVLTNSYALLAGAAPHATPAVCLQRNGKELRSGMNKFCFTNKPIWQGNCPLTRGCLSWSRP